jgi:hypothetical protein
MKAKTLVAGGVAAGGSAALLLRKLLSSEGSGHHDGHTADRWHFVTINRSPEEVHPGDAWPEPLAELGDRIDVQVRPAPDAKGTEVGARLRGRLPTGAAEAAARLSGKDPRQELRWALRRTQWLLETGEVLKPDPRPSTHRTVTSLPLKLATRHARGEGRL